MLAYIMAASLYVVICVGINDCSHIVCCHMYQCTEMQPLPVAAFVNTMLQRELYFCTKIHRGGQHTMLYVALVTHACVCML